jgi:hypothetical protein
VISDEWGAETMLEDSDVLTAEISTVVSVRLEDFVLIAMTTLFKLLVSVVTL